MKVRDLKKMKLIKNPPLDVDLVSFVLPGFAAFAATNLLARQLPLNVKPLGRNAHGPMLAAAAAFAAAYWGAHRMPSLKPHHTPIVVGSGLALLQMAVTRYLPHLRGLVNGSATLPAGPAMTRGQALATYANAAPPEIIPTITTLPTQRTTAPLPAFDTQDKPWNYRPTQSPINDPRTTEELNDLAAEMREQNMMATSFDEGMFDGGFGNLDEALADVELS